MPSSRIGDMLSKYARQLDQFRLVLENKAGAGSACKEKQGDEAKISEVSPPTLAWVSG